MVRVAPFRALRYDRAVAGPEVETSAPAYDELDRFRYASHRTSNPYTVLELISGGQDVGTHAPGGKGPHAHARATLDRWQRTGVLTVDAHPAMYVYEAHELRHGRPVVQRGVLAALDLEDVDDGALLLHEDVDDVRAASRAARLAAVPVDLTPVVAVHLGGAAPGLANAVAAAQTTAPLAAFTDEVGMDHRVWRIADPAGTAVVAEAYRGVTAVLADGHHRVEAARRMRTVNGPAAGWGRTLTWLVDAHTDGPELRAVHRYTTAAPPRGADGLPRLPGFRTLPWHAGAEALPSALVAVPGVAFGLVTGTDAWLLRAEDPNAVRARTAAMAGALLGTLDIEVLRTIVLPAFGEGAATQPVFDLAQAAADLRSGGTGTLLLVAPPSVEQVLLIARSGARMPAKSTRFRPKPRAGLVMRRLD